MPSPMVHGSPAGLSSPTPPERLLPAHPRSVGELGRGKPVASPGQSIYAGFVRCPGLLRTGGPQRGCRPRPLVGATAPQQVQAVAITRSRDGHGSVSTG